MLFPAKSLKNRVLISMGITFPLVNYVYKVSFLLEILAVYSHLIFRILITIWEILPMLRVTLSPLFHFPICKTEIVYGVQYSEFINKDTVENLDTVMLTMQKSYS